MLFNVLLLKVVANYQPLGLAVKSGTVTGERNERNAENGSWNAENRGGNPGNVRNRVGMQ